MSPVPPIFDEYIDFVRHHRALTEGTLVVLRRHVEPFLFHLGELAQSSRLREVSPATVRGFVTARADPRGRSEKRAVCYAVRSFLRYASMRGYVGHELIEAVPKIRTYSLAPLPRALPWRDVERILEAVDRSSRRGKRDYAFLMLLVTYGLRLGEVVRLRLDDIEWRHDRFSIMERKAGGPLVLPLTEDVGEALLEYLKHGRPDVDHRQVFLQLNPPHLPLSPRCGGARQIVKRYMTQAEISGRAAVPHALRHSLASRLLQEGQSIKVIADVLGHASLRTTSIYTKIDIDHLREVALEIPEVPR